jgi:hypothetical protein
MKILNNTKWQCIILAIAGIIGEILTPATYPFGTGFIFGILSLLFIAFIVFIILFSIYDTIYTMKLIDKKTKWQAPTAILIAGILGEIFSPGETLGIGFFVGVTFLVIFGILIFFILDLIFN